MICDNCGAKIRNKESFCPRCGMEFFNSEHKPLQKKFLRGEYRDQDEVQVAPYNLDEADYSKDNYQKEPYQNWDDYDPDYVHESDENIVQDKEPIPEEGYEPDQNNNQDYNNNRDDQENYKGNKPYNTKYNSDKSYKNKYNSDQGHDKNYSDEKGYNNRYNRQKSSKRNYNTKGHHNQKKYPTRGYDLDEYESKPKKSSIWSTVVLFLLLALLIGFVMGFIFFSSKIQNLF